MVKKVTLPLTALAVYSLLKNLLFCDNDALRVYENTVVSVEVDGKKYELYSAELCGSELNELVLKAVPEKEYED